MEYDVSDPARKSSDGECVPANAANPPEVFPAAGSAGRENVVTVCAWCPELHVIKLDRRPGDLFSYCINGMGKLEQVTRRREEEWEILEISDGICPACRATLFAEPGI